MIEKYEYKNVKVKDKIHSMIKIISAETGINIGKLIEMGVQKIIDDYNSGIFNSLKDTYTKIRRDGSLSRI